MTLEMFAGRGTDLLLRIVAVACSDRELPRMADPDGFLRYKVMSALGRLRRADERLTFPADKIEASILRDNLDSIAGAMCCFGVTPLAFDGDPAAWADALDGLVDLAGIVVPGHGPPGGTSEIRDLQAYLRACVTADGDPAAIGPGPWDEWSGRQWDEVNVALAAMLAAGDRGVPPSMLRAAGLA